MTKNKTPEQIAADILEAHRKETEHIASGVWFAGREQELSDRIASAIRAALAQAQGAEHNSTQNAHMDGKLSDAESRVAWPSEKEQRDWYAYWRQSHAGNEGWSSFNAIEAYNDWLKRRMGGGGT